MERENSGLKEDNWFLMFSSVFNVLKYYLARIKGENLDAHRCVVEIIKCILIATTEECLCLVESRMLKS